MNIKLSEAIRLYLVDKRGQGLSPNTLADYRTTFKKLQAFLSCDPTISSIEADTVRDFFNSVTGITNKTKLNYHAGLSALWTWATEERKICKVHIIREIKPARPEKVSIVPFSQAEVKKIIAGLINSKPFPKSNGELVKPRLLDPLIAARNRAIILFLLDSGLRASELCGLKLGDIRTGEHGVYLVDVSQLYAKYSRGRVVPISSRTFELVQKYLQLRGQVGPDEYLFLADNGEKLRRDTLRQMLVQVKERCGLKVANAHKFRHTFAINFLRNGGDVFTLQAILGHSTFDMVKRYLAIAETDIERGHAKASPVTNWEL